MRWPHPPQKAKADATILPQLGQGMLSTGGGENGEEWGDWTGGTADVEGTEVATDGAAKGPEPG